MDGEQWDDLGQHDRKLLGCKLCHIFGRHDWVFLKVWKDIFTSGQAYQDAADQSSPISLSKAGHAEMYWRSSNAKPISPPNGNCQNTSPGTPSSYSFPSFCSKCFMFTHFYLSWQPCNLPAGFIPSFTSSPPVKEAKYSSLCSTSWCPDSVLADILSTLLLRMGLDKSSKL